MKLFITLLWWIWFSINKWVKCKEIISADSTILWVDRFLSNLAETNSTQITPNHMQHDGGEIREIIWSPPPKNRYKLNVDATLMKDLKSFSVSMIIRDSIGQVLLAAALNWEGPPSVAEAKAKAIWEGMYLALEMGFFDLVIESDSLFVLKMIEKTDKKSTYSGVGLLISDISDLSLDFWSSNFTHVSRKQNGPAHLLAKYRLSSFLDSIWI